MLAATTVFEIVCPNCKVPCDVDLERLNSDPDCDACGEPLGTLQRIEGFVLFPRPVKA